MALARPKFLFAFTDIDDRDYCQELEILNAQCDFLDRIVVFDDATDKPIPPEFLPYAGFIARAGRTELPALQSRRDSVTPDDAAVIIFTSGTTGKPKGAMHCHYGLIHCAYVELGHWPDPEMRVLQNMPINHIANIGMMSAVCLVAGGSLIYQDRFDPARVPELIAAERISFWLQSPVQFQMVAAEPGFETEDLSSLNFVIWGGGPMPMHVLEKLRKLDCVVATAYGMTELTAYATYSDLEEDSAVLAEVIGKPESAYELRVMTANGMPAGVGESGEIQARGRWLMNGYFDQPEETAEAFTDDGWFKTGDVAEILADGNWKLIGRTKEMYKSGGYNIYPREIEIVIEEHPAVALTAVLGIDDPLYDEVGYAFVQPQADMELSASELDSWCRARLANYKIPKTFEIIPELPKLPIGKIDKQTLRQTLQVR